MYIRMYIHFVSGLDEVSGEGKNAVKTTTMSESRAHYAQIVDAVVDDWEEVVVSGPNGENVVIVWESALKETSNLLNSPANAAG